MTSFFSWLSTRRQPSTRTQLSVDQLEGRDVPSATLSLTTAGSSGWIDGVQYLQAQARPTGTGFYYPATVLTGVAADNPILQEEIFGPVAPIVAVADADEAVRLANGTTMGLVAYVYTRDLAKGLRVAEALESGMVGLNKGIVSDPAAPFGGVKESGIGREGGHEGMLDYTETKYIATDW